MMRTTLVALGMVIAMASSCANDKEENMKAGKTVAGTTATNTLALSAADREYLLNLARQTVCWYLDDRSVPAPDGKGLPESVKVKAPCFVTLEHKRRGLRGCLGMFERTTPLFMNVISRAVAATKDGRFAGDPVTYKEMKDIRIDISVLSEPRNLPFDSPEDLISKLRPNTDGVILFTRYGSSTFLPQVWEQLPDKEEFLGHLCYKHGAPPDTWKTEWRNIRVQVYEALVFSETDTERRIVGRNGAKAGEKGAVVLGHVDPAMKDAVKPGEVAAGEPLKAGTIVKWDSDVER